MDQPSDSKLFGLRQQTAIIIGIIIIALIIVIYLYFVSGDDQSEDASDEKSKKSKSDSESTGSGALDDSESCITNSIKRILNRQSRNLKSMC